MLHEKSHGTVLGAAPFLLVVAAAAVVEGVKVLVDVDTVSVASVVKVEAATVLITVTVVAATAEPDTVADDTVVVSTVEAGITVVPVDVESMYTMLPRSEKGIALPIPDAVYCGGMGRVAVLGFADGSVS